MPASVIATEYVESNCRVIQTGWAFGSSFRSNLITVSLIGGRSPPEPLVTMK